MKKPKPDERFERIVRALEKGSFAEARRAAKLLPPFDRVLRTMSKLGGPFPDAEELVEKVYLDVHYPRASARPEFERRVLRLCKAFAKGVLRLYETVAKGERTPASRQKKSR